MKNVDLYVELTHNHGTEDQKDFKCTCFFLKKNNKQSLTLHNTLDHNGNTEPKGICMYQMYINVL